MSNLHEKVSASKRGVSESRDASPNQFMRVRCRSWCSRQTQGICVEADGGTESSMGNGEVDVCDLGDE